MLGGINSMNVLREPILVINTHEQRIATDFLLYLYLLIAHHIWTLMFVSTN